MPNCIAYPKDKKDKNMQPARDLFLSVFLSMVIATSLTLSSNSFAKTIAIKIGGHIAEADYTPGTKKKSAILVLHDFLQTRRSDGVRQISAVARKAGYTVLAPTLTYGRDRRRQNMRCNSPHTHTAEQDGREIQRWVGWLRKRGYSRITLIGHATNSALALYAAGKLGLPVQRIVLVGYAPFSDGKAVRSRALPDNRRLKKWFLKPCGFRFVATPASFHSYNRLTNSNLSRYFKKLKGITKIIAPSSVVARRGNDYLALTGSKKHLVTIKGNNTLLFAARRNIIGSQVANVLAYN